MIHKGYKVEVIHDKNNPAKFKIEATPQVDLVSQKIVEAHRNITALINRELDGQILKTLSDNQLELLITMLKEELDVRGNNY